jgi:hypothetical protein
MNAWLEGFAARTAAASPRPPDAGEDEAPYADAWMEVRRRRRAMLLNPAGGFAVLIVLFLLAESFAALRPLAVFAPFCALSIFVGWTVSLFRYGFFRCPRCSRVFNAGPLPDPSIDRVFPHDPDRCGHCHLRMWSVNDAGLPLREYERRMKRAEAEAAAAGLASTPSSADAPPFPLIPDLPIDCAFLIELKDGLTQRDQRNQRKQFSSGSSGSSV